MVCKFGHTHHHVKQDNNQTCGTACVEMVCRSLAKNLEYSNFQTNFYNAFKGNDPGLTHTPIANILSGLGIQTVCHSTREVKNVGDLLRTGAYPIIAEVMFDLKAGGTGLHWVVVDGRKKNLINDEFCVLDPSQEAEIYITAPKKGVVSYKIADGRTLNFTGRMVKLA